MHWFSKPIFQGFEGLNPSISVPPYYTTGKAEGIKIQSWGMNEKTWFLLSKT